MVDFRNIITSSPNAWAQFGAGLANGGLGGAAAGYANGLAADIPVQQQTQQKNATLAALANAGRHDLVDYVNGGGDIQSAWGQYLSDAQAAKKEAKDKQKRIGSAAFITDPNLRDAYVNGLIELPDVFKQMADANGGSANWSNSTVPVQSTNWNGTKHFGLGQVNDRGGAHMVDFGPGVQAVEPTTAVDLGTTKAMVGKSGDVRNTFPVDNQGAAKDTATGKVIGETVGGAVTGAPRAALQMQQANDVADKVLSNSKGMDEAFGNILGVPQQMTPAFPGTAKADFQNDVNELISKSWLTVRNDLKGAGQVTDYEGAKAEAAVSQMGAALKSGSKAAFIQAVNDYKAAVAAGYALIAQQAQGGGAANAASPAQQGAAGSADPVAAADALLQSGKY